MPEKIADKVEANGAARPMPEKAVETTRRYVKEAEKAGEDAFRMYNDLMETTTEYFFDTLDKTMHDTMEIMTHTEHAMEEMMAIYRRNYTDGIKSWRTYWQDVTKTFPRPR
jgi:hypothetical protein